MHLMLLGHVGVVVVIPSVILSFINIDSEQDRSSQVALRTTVLGSGMLLLLLITNSQVIDRILCF